MKVGFVLLHPFSESMASGVRTIELAKSLKKLGIESVIFTPYERTHIRDGIKVVSANRLFSALKIENSMYHVSRRLYYERTLQKAIIKMAKVLSSGVIGSSELAGVLKEHEIDIVQAEQDNAAAALLSARKKLAVPIVLDLHGIWPEELLAAAAIQQGSKVWKDLQDLMKHIISEVDLTVCLSDAMEEYVLTNYGVPNGKIAVVPPGGRVLPSEFANKTNPPKVVYAGIVSYRKHVDLFVRSMPYVKRDKDVEFFITKKGDLLGPIQRLALNLKVNPNYFWFRDLGETLRFMQSCHVGILPSTNDTSSKISMPSKLFDYLSVGLPVVANEVGGWTDIIKENNVGKVTMDDPEDFARGISGLLDDPKEMAKTALKGMELIRNTYNWDVSAKILAQRYEKLL